MPASRWSRTRETRTPPHQPCRSRGRTKHRCPPAEQRTGSASLPGGQVAARSNHTPEPQSLSLFFWLSLRRDPAICLFSPRVEMIKPIVAERSCPVCGRRYYKRTGQHRSCTPACRERERARPAAGREGEIRFLAPGAAEAVGAPRVAAGVMTCWRCGELIAASEAFDLGHVDDDPSRYAGAEHRRCSRASGADLTNARRLPPDGPPEEAIEDPSGGWWGPVSELKGGRPYRPRWSRNWLA